MPKKSHRIASRQAAISKERKRRKRSPAAHPHPMPTKPAAPAIDPEVSKPPIAEEQATVTVTKPSPAAHPTFTRYQYIIPEIRKTAILAAVIIAALIALSFILV